MISTNRNVQVAAKTNPSPLDGLRRKPYLDFMPGDVALIVRSLPRALFAFFLIVCVAVAPICVARCSSTLCASPSHSSDSCHQSSAAGGEGPALACKTNVPCANAQFLFTIPRLESFSAPLMSNVLVPAVLLHLPNHHVISSSNSALLELTVAAIPITAPVPLRI
jgi:hypothetical protein